MFRFLKKTAVVLLIAVVGLIGSVFLKLFFDFTVGRSDIAISPQTTWIIAPLTDDGLPDYEIYLLQEGFDGVTPDKNAAVLLWQAIWPEEVSAADRRLVLEALGLKDLSESKSDYLQSLSAEPLRQRVAAWLLSHYQRELDGKIPERFRDEADFLGELTSEVSDWVIQKAREQPWTADRLPPMAEWTTLNHRSLDLLVQASQRPRYFSPSPATLNDQYDGLIVRTIPMTNGMRFAARALGTRAMQRIGGGDVEGAWQDTLACYRLAQLLGQRGSLVQRLVAIGMDEMACRQSERLLHHGNLIKAQAKQILDALQALPILPEMCECFDRDERLSYVDNVVALATGRTDDFDMKGRDFTGALDWNFVLRDGNDFYDRFVAAARISNRLQRDAAIAELEQELAERDARISHPLSLITAMVSRRHRGESVSSIMLNLMLPATGAALRAEDRSSAHRQLVVTAAALAVFRAQQGAYPEQLSELIPDFLEELPPDPYSGTPFVYSRKADGGYALYSVFENGIDDGGTDLSGDVIRGEWQLAADGVLDYENSDLVIRVPVPKFGLPALPNNWDEWALE